MTLQDLIRRARIRLDDRVSPYQWSDDELTAFANAAQEEACRVGFLLRREETLTVVADSTVSAPTTETILHVFSATSDDEPLHILTPPQMAKMQAAYSQSGKPIYASFDGTNNTLTVLPAPEQAISIVVTYASIPGEDDLMFGPSDEPVISPAHHLSLVYWIVAEALSDADADKANPTKAEQEESKFYRSFGSPISAKALRATAAIGVGKHVYGRRFGAK